MTICYLDPEDEITGAVARIRAVEDRAAILVLPPGSRIATSRINFRLLGREAEQAGIDLVAVSDEPGVRALAISAGVPAYDSVAAAEAGLTEFARQEERLAARTGRAAEGPPPPKPTRSPSPARPRDDAEGTRVMALPRGLDEPAADGGREERYAAAAARSARRARRRRSRWLPLLAVALAVALIGVAAYGAYLFVPSPALTNSHAPSIRCNPRAIDRGSLELVINAPTPGTRTWPPCVCPHTIRS